MDELVKQGWSEQTAALLVKEGEIRVLAAQCRREGLDALARDLERHADEVSQNRAYLQAHEAGLARLVTDQGPPCELCGAPASYLEHHCIDGDDDGCDLYADWLPPSRVTPVHQGDEGAEALRSVGLSESQIRDAQQLARDV